MRVYDQVDNAADGSSQWLCRCTCGTERIVKGKRLVRGDTASCGCSRHDRNSKSRIQNLEVGRKFGKWQIVSFDGIKNGKDHWLCRCACGKVTSVNGSNLRRGLSLSCGTCGA